MDLISSISIDLVIGILKLSVVLVSRYQVGEKKYGGFTLLAFFFSVIFYILGRGNGTHASCSRL